MSKQDNAVMLSERGWSWIEATSPVCNPSKIIGFLSNRMASISTQASSISIQAASMIDAWISEVHFHKESQEQYHHMIPGRESFQRDLSVFSDAVFAHAQGNGHPLNLNLCVISGHEASLNESFQGYLSWLLDRLSNSFELFRAWKQIFLQFSESRPKHAARSRQLKSPKRFVSQSPSSVSDTTHRRILSGLDLLQYSVNVVQNWYRIMLPGLYLLPTNFRRPFDDIRQGV